MLSWRERPDAARAATTPLSEKLRAVGPNLPYPHSSNVEGSKKLRELRPRGGRSVTRPLYRQFGDVFVVGAYAPEAESDKRGFARACREAERRLGQMEE